MRRMALLLGVGLLVAAGCADKQQPASDAELSASPSVLDVSGSSSASYAPAKTYTPAPAPIAVEPAVAVEPAAPVASSSGSSYMVKKGDTLYGIARMRYGDGKAWKRIADANPGINPQGLKVGQTLMIP